jgi:hypothetical protein
LLGALILVALAGACGGSDGGAVHVAWQSREGGPVRLQLKANDTYQTDVLVHNASSDTLRDVRLHLRQQNPTLGIGIVGTVTSTRTEHGYDGDYWRLGDLRPGQSVAFPLGLWIEVSPQVKGASGLDLTIDLVSRDLDEPLTSTPLRIEAD